MGDFLLVQPGAWFLGDVVWQSTLLLCLGLAASGLVARRPARAHRSLLLAVLAAMITPILAQGARLGGWGILTTGSERQPAASAPGPIAISGASTALEESRPRALISNKPVLLGGSGERLAPDPIVPAIAAPGRTVSVPNETTIHSLAYRSISWRRLALGLWMSFTGIALVRLFVGFVRGLKLVRKARPSMDPSLVITARGSAERMGLVGELDLRSSPHVRCPAIWCWGIRPVIVLPEAMKPTVPVDWAGIFCHELAHWVRRDQWSGLFADLLVCALPWHPLAWWARQRLGQLSELACDDWVLSTGLPAPEYAESLLELVAQKRGGVALAAVTSRRGLFSRVRHILDERRSSPAIGTCWAGGSAIVMVLAASALALAQSRPVSAKDQGPLVKAGVATVKESENAPSGEKTATKHTISGKVLGADGKPLAGATVFLIGSRKPPVSPSALPRDQQGNRSRFREALARANTDLNGVFSLISDHDPDRYERTERAAAVLLARAPGTGMVSEMVELGASGVTIRLEPEAVIRGRLLAPSGMPAAGVLVSLNGFTRLRRGADDQGMHLGFIEPGDEVPAYWPAPRKTDAGGRFTLEGLPREAFATLDFRHPEYAVDEITVNLTSDGAVPDGLRSFEIVPVSPTFTHTLEPARPVQGRVTEKSSGKPLPDMLVQVIPMRPHGGMPFYGRTDADGRYRISGHQAETFYVTVFPQADSGYLSQDSLRQGWPAGAKFLEKNFALDMGRIVRGQVTDAGTKRPVASAAVVYQPKRGNPNNTGGYEFRNTVLTDQRGRFAITALPGQGSLAVETPDESFIRVVLKDSYRGTVFPQGVAPIDVPKEGEPKPAAIEVRKGVTLEAKAIGPDGQVVREITGFCKGIDAKLIDVWDKGQPFSDGIFRLPGADPNKTYRVYFLQYKQRLGAVASLKFDPDAKKPIEVRLEPTAKVHGTIASPAGSPAVGGQVLPYLLLDEQKSEMKPDDFHNRENALVTVQLFPNEGWDGFFDKCRLQGKYEFEHLIAGARYGISVTAGNLQGVGTAPLLKPGEDHDLGTITLKERQP
jgi:beta-lactamase regulating signal transducer with metallopeptidase domain